MHMKSRNRRPKVSFHQPPKRTFRQQPRPMEPDDLLVLIDTGFANAGLFVAKATGKVNDCAPILRKWFMGRTLEQVQQTCAKRNWKCELIP